MSRYSNHSVCSVDRSGGGKKKVKRESSRKAIVRHPIKQMKVSEPDELWTSV